ncbi:hypothetical protein L6R50_03455 [Myxococcota bacterium]|nr:hypothetical protein [Myxococcota bacterium]
MGTPRLISCPSCQRPNGPRPRCLYCGAPLPSADPEASGGAPEAETRREGGGAPSPGSPFPAPQAPPPPPAVPDLLRGLGPFGRRRAAARLVLVPDPAYGRSLPWLKVRLFETLGIDAYTATLLLQRDVPCLLREVADAADARARAERLAERGIRTVLLTPEGVAPYASPRGVDSCRIGLHRVLLDSGGQPVEVSAGAVSRVVLGEIRPPPAGPQTREVKGPLFTRSTQIEPRAFADIQTPYWLADLHIAGGPPFLRIRADSFDYGCLGPERGISAWHNLNVLVARLQAVLGDFPIDKSFRKVAQVSPERPPPTDEADAGAGRGEEVAFTEYGMLLDLCARSAAPVPAPTPSLPGDAP